MPKAHDGAHQPLEVKREPIAEVAKETVYYVCAIEGCKWTGTKVVSTDGKNWKPK